MIVLIAANLALAQAGGSVLHLFTEPEFCAIMQRNIAAQPVQDHPPIRVSGMVADCRAKRVRAAVHIAQVGQQYTATKDSFVAVARSGVCNLSDPTMRAFHQRGWKFAYRFSSSDGQTGDVTLTC